MAMRLVTCLVLVCISARVYAQDEPKERKNALVPSLSLSLNSNGLAPIPSFALGKPAFMISANLVKGRFSYDPTLGYSLEMKPWFIDSWFHYKVVASSTFDLTAGVNFSTFCSGISINGKELLQAERYFAFALAGTYKLTPVASVLIDYWSDNGQEEGGLKGHFINVAFDRSDIRLAEWMQLEITLMLFYINYTGNNDGLFFSPTLSLSSNDVPATLFFQSTQAIAGNIEPWPGFQWNVGISYSL